MGHFLLTNLIMSKSESAGQGSRIVNLTSNGQHTKCDLTTTILRTARFYNLWFAYGQSKTANILSTVGLAMRLPCRGILPFAVHPGAIRTNLGPDIDQSEWPKVAKLFSDRGM